MRRDELQAKALEEEEERRMQEVDAERRIQVLRGERPSTPPPAPSSPKAGQDKTSHREGDRDARISNRKRRRLAGEDDTDRDIRIARQDVQVDDGKTVGRPRASDAPLEDKTGHINLFPAETKRNDKAEKNAEAEAESEATKRKYEDQYTMRFSNAGGSRQSIGQNPWYSSSERDHATDEAIPGKNVWGNEDPMRKQREMARMDANNPLAAMRKGVRQLKSVEQERKKWNDERARELEDLKSADGEKERSSRHHRRKRSPSRTAVSDDSLEGFELDAAPAEKHRDRRNRERRSHEHRHHHRRHRDRSRDHSRRKHSHTHSRSHRHHRSRHDDSRSSRRLSEATT